MIRGRVNQLLEPVINVSVLDDHDIAHNFDFILDTGFSGHLMLPSDVIDRLGLNYSGQRAVAMADGFTHNVDVFMARLLLYENWRPVFVIRLDRLPLLGMRSLLGCSLSMNVQAGGRIVVEETFGAARAAHAVLAELTASLQTGGVRRSTRSPRRPTLSLPTRTQRRAPC